MKIKYYQVFVRHPYTNRTITINNCHKLTTVAEFKQKIFKRIGCNVDFVISGLGTNDNNNTLEDCKIINHTSIQTYYRLRSR